jgi:dienelactone hydrolase
MSDPAWKRRFTTPTISEVKWSPGRPERLGVISTEDGSSQAWAWDLGSGQRRRVSFGGAGAEEVHVTPDGSGVVWWFDATGDERGRWMRTPFEGGEPGRLLDGIPDGWMSGIALVASTVALGLSMDDDYRVFVSRGDEPARELYRHTQPAGVGREWPQGGGGLSADGSLLCIRQAEEGDISHQALRVFDTTTGAVVGDLGDPGRALMPCAWSPTDRKLALIHERDGIERPAVWDLSTGERRDVGLPDLPGPVMPVDWFPDGQTLLLHHEHAGHHSLLRCDVAAGTSETIVDIAGTITQAAVRPDGDVWSIRESSTDPPSVRNGRDDEVIGLGERPPAGRSFRAISWENPPGQTIHGFVVTPEGIGPFPTIVSVHGGPEWHHTDGWDPTTQAYVDNGFAVLLVNYRGSTGFGTAFREALKGNIGFPETEDVNAGLDHVIRLGLADATNVFLEGWSWGGYIATLNAGLHPERWRAVMGGIPVGDYVTAHYECAPAIRADDFAKLGGSPMDLPELYKERNPITYVDRVTAPMLLIAGEHDSRCPLGQVMTYAHALRVRNHPVEVYLYGAGHHANDVVERIHHIELTVGFFRRYLG